MNEETKIDTQLKSFRLPVDVIEILERWAGETGQSATAVLATCIRVASEDEKRITKAVVGGESVLQEGENGVGVIQIRQPNSRDTLADAITTLLRESEAKISENGQNSALGVARARLYQKTSAYQAAKPLRDVGILPPEAAFITETRKRDALLKPGAAKKAREK